MTPTVTIGTIIKMKSILRFLCLLILLIGSFAANVYPQSSAPTHPVDGKYIREWLALGPFNTPDLKIDLLASVGGEAKVNPKVGDTLTTADGEVLTWTPYKSESDIIDLLRAVGNHENATAYAFCYLQSESDRKFHIRFGSDDGAAVFLNGQRVLYNPALRAFIANNDQFGVPLLAGKTRCLIKVANAAQDWKFAMRVGSVPQVAKPASGKNHVLSLDGDGDYVRLPDDIGHDLDEATIEAWVRWHSFREFSQPLSFGSVEGSWQVMAISNRAHTSTLQFFIYQGTDKLYLVKVPDILELEQWYHIAAVTGKEGMKLYLNGALVGTNNFTGSFSTLQRNRHNYFGKSHWKQNADFHGQLDEIRVWRIARTEKQIQETMFRRLRGDEPGLVGYWSFEGDEERAKDATNAQHGVMYGDATRVAADLSTDVRKRAEIQPPKSAQISGVISDTNGAPLSGAHVSLTQNHKVISQTTTDSKGHYLLSAPSGRYELLVADGKKGYWRLEVLRTDERRILNLTPRRTSRITGRVSAGGIPQTQVFVQLLISSNNEFPEADRVVAGTFSDENGEFQFINLMPGAYHLRCRILGGDVYYKSGENRIRQGTEDDDNLPFGDILHVKSGENRQLDFRLRPFKKGVWKTFTTADGLPTNEINALHQDNNGILWIGTNAGVSSYDGKTFQNLSTKDGLPHNSVNAIYQDTAGNLWFGTSNGVSRYDGETFANFAIKGDHPGSNWILSINQTSVGDLWVGTSGGGVFRYEPDSLPVGRDSFPTRSLQSDSSEQFVKVTLTGSWGASVYVNAIYQATVGDLWLGTKDGALRYDGEDFVRFTIADGLTHNYIYAIHQDNSGAMWFGTELWGVSRYDGERFVNFTTENGLAHNSVATIYQDSSGTLWFGTGGSGISRYDGLVQRTIKRRRAVAETTPSFVNFTTKDGLADNVVRAIHQDSAGAIWFGTADGLSRYDERTFVNFTVADGLAHNHIRSSYRDSKDRLWFGTLGGGVSRYDPPSSSERQQKSGGSEGVREWGREEIPSSNLQSSIFNLQSPPLRFANFTTVNGLAHNHVLAVCQDREGIMWFGTDRGGVSSYDGVNFVNFNFAGETGVASSNRVSVICPDRAGGLWLGTYIHGVFHYDGTVFDPFPLPGGWVDNTVNAIHVDSAGGLWIGTTSGGVSLFDPPRSPLRKGGSKGGVVNVATSLGLMNDTVYAIESDTAGRLWFGTNGSGVYRYDGVRQRSPGFDGRSGKTTQSANFTTADGLANDVVRAIHQDAAGQLWFATERGVSMYDGTAWSTLDTRDGLIDDRTTTIVSDSEGVVWFGTQNGLTRFKGNATAPRVHIVSVKTDQVYADLANIPPITTGARVTFRCNAVDLKTHPDKRQYRVQIQCVSDQTKRAADTEQVSMIHHQSSMDWTPKKPGTYTVSVQAIDRDLNYSETAQVTLSVIPPWYFNAWIAIPSAGGIAGLLIASLFFGWRNVAHRRESARLREQMLDQEREGRRRIENYTRELAKSNEQLESARAQADTANRAKSTFLANMSHEIRTPMNAILGYAQLLQRADELPQQHREAVSTIGRSGNHLLSLIDEVLDISRIESGRMELEQDDFDLTALINDLSVMFRLRCQGKHLNWTVEWEHHQDTAQILVHGDEGRLKQVLINLLSNAIKFTNAGGIVLRISEFTDGRNLFTFSVIDTGIGISPSDQATIFDPFQQSDNSAKREGTGLGLTIAQKLVHLMGGNLDVESAPGEGSRFFFSVPLPPAQSDVQAHKDENAQRIQRLADGFSVKAVVADDVKENRDVLEQMLSAIGCEVILAENGQEAVEAVREHRPDIVFMDIRMPVIDGLEATRRIVAEFGRGAFKLVAVSASALTHQRQRYFSAGFDEFIPKPIQAQEIYACLAKFLHVEYKIEYHNDDMQSENLTEISLPEELLGRLKGAAEVYSTSEIRRHLEELKQLGESGQRLAQHLETLNEDSDMEGILEVLEQIRR